MAGADASQRVVKAALLVALVAGVVVVGFLTLRAWEAARELEGDSVVVVEKAADVQEALQLDVNRTLTEAPAFDRLLFEAFRDGRATSNDPAVVAEVRSYLDALARERGHSSFAEPPFENTFRWDEDTFRVTYLGDAPPDAATPTG